MSGRRFGVNAGEDLGQRGPMPRVTAILTLELIDDTIDLTHCALSFCSPRVIVSGQEQRRQDVEEEESHGVRCARDEDARAVGVASAHTIQVRHGTTTFAVDPMSSQRRVGVQLALSEDLAPIRARPPLRVGPAPTRAAEHLAELPPSSVPVRRGAEPKVASW